MPLLWELTSRQATTPKRCCMGSNITASRSLWQVTPQRDAVWEVTSQPLSHSPKRCCMESNTTTSHPPKEMLVVWEATSQQVTPPKRSCMGSKITAIQRDAITMETNITASHLPKRCCTGSNITANHFPKEMLYGKEHHGNPKEMLLLWELTSWQAILPKRCYYYGN